MDEVSKLFADVEVHFMGDGVVGAGGSVAGERALMVADKMLGGR